MGILQENRLSFNDAAILAESATLFYQNYEDSKTMLQYFGDMREASSLHRRDNIHGIGIRKVRNLAGLTQAAHKALIGMTANTGGLLDKEALGKTHPDIASAITDFEAAVRGFREHVRMFTSPDLIPADVKKELEEKAKKAGETIETLQALPSVPIAFTLYGMPFKALVPKPEPEYPNTPKVFLSEHHEMARHPGILMVALQYAARGGIVDKHRSPEAVQEFYAKTVGVAMDTAVRREVLAEMVRAALAKEPYLLTTEQIEAVVPKMLSQEHHGGIAGATFGILPRKRNFFLKLNTLVGDEGYDTLADWFTASLEDENALLPASKIRPESAQEAFMVLLLITHKAQTHERFSPLDVEVNDLLSALDQAYHAGSDSASLGAFAKDDRLPKILAHIKPFLEPSSPEMTAYYEIESLVPPNARPGGESKPKPRRRNR